MLLGGCLLINSTQHLSKDTTAPGREESPGTTLPSLDEAKEPIPVPSEKPVPPALSYYEAGRQLKELFPSHLKPLVIRGRMPLLLHDLNRDDNPEGFSLGIAGKDLKRSEINQLSDYSRLFKEENKAVTFYLLFFGNNQGKLFRKQTIYLGKWHVYASFRKIQLEKNRSTPIVITVSFQTLEGTERELMVFNDASGVPLYRTPLKDTLSAKSLLEDIDGDGILDLFILEKGMEEGTGYETFLTWYRWNGRNFVETRSKNVVRNLRTFLADVKEYLLAGKIHELISFSLDPKLVKRQMKLGLDETRILADSLGLDVAAFTELSEIREVIFPEILEDPFTAQDERGSSFHLHFRIVDKSGISHIGDTLLYMLRNPFGERQFIFYPD